MAAKGKPRIGGNQCEADNQNSQVDNAKIDQKPRKSKVSHPFAAVYADNDPRAKNLARAIPPDAQLEMLGSSVAGYWKDPRGKLRLPKSWTTVMTLQRLNELQRVVRYRRAYGLDAGPPIGWCVVLADLAAALKQEVNVTSVDDLCRRIGLPTIDPAVVAGVAHHAEPARRVWTQYRLLSAEAAGNLIELTSIEREECEIKRIDAADEPAHERKRRLAKERQRKKRERNRNDVTRTII